MNRRAIRGASVLFFLTLVAACSFAQEKSKPADAPIGETASRVLREMSDYLAHAQTLTFRVDSTLDAVRSSGQKIQLSMAEEVSIARPGSIRVDMVGDKVRGRVHCDGKTFVLYDAIENTYASADARDSLGETLDGLWEAFAIDVPMADFLYPDPHAVLTERVEHGEFVGKHQVQGVMCDHLAFRQPAIDWQIWVEDGRRRVPRKMVITYKNAPGSPQYTALLSDWHLDRRLSDHIFRFNPPAGAEKIEFMVLEAYQPDSADEQGGDQ